MALRVEDLTALAPSFSVPKALEAREPAEVRGAGRDDVRLLVTRGDDGSPEHARFSDLPSMLRPGDVLVLNASATIPSSLHATDGGGASFRVNVSTRGRSGRCIVEARGADVRAGAIASLPGGATLLFQAPHRDSKRLWTALLRDAGDIVTYLYRYADPVAYPHVDRAWPIETYQNVYATEAGSAEMPSAGRPITRSVLDRLDRAGIATVSIILHTGLSSPERDEPPYAEFLKVTTPAAAAIETARRAGGRVIAVGTTVVRALESAADANGRVRSARGWTDLVIAPDARLRVVDAMITGFHEPRSTHLAILQALAGVRHIERAYEHALDGKYLWHEFGDSHLVLP